MSRIRHSVSWYYWTRDQLVKAICMPPISKEINVIQPMHWSSSLKFIKYVAIILLIILRDNLKSEIWLKTMLELGAWAALGLSLWMSEQFLALFKHQRATELCLQVANWLKSVASSGLKDIGRDKFEGVMSGAQVWPHCLVQFADSRKCIVIIFQCTKAVDLCFGFADPIVQMDVWQALNFKRNNVSSNIW